LLLVGLGINAMRRRAPVIVAVYLLSIPMALALLVALDFRIWPRYFFVDIGFVFLCVAAGAVALADWLAARIGRPNLANALLVAGTLVMVAASSLLLVRNYARPKQDFAGALALIAAQRAPDDVATSIGLASAPLKSYLAPGWPGIATEADLNALDKQGTWIVTAFDDHVLAGQEATMARIAREYNLAASFDGTLGGGTVKVYRKTAEAELKETSK
jgi:hypothetical protein